jgi:hypothetical protein
MTDDEPGNQRWPAGMRADMGNEDGRHGSYGQGVNYVTPEALKGRISEPIRRAFVTKHL